MVAQVGLSDHPGSERGCWNWECAVALLPAAGTSHLNYDIFGRRLEKRASLRFHIAPVTQNTSKNMMIRAYLGMWVNTASALSLRTYHFQKFTCKAHSTTE